MDEVYVLNPVHVAAFLNPDLVPECRFNHEHVDEVFVDNDKLHPWTQAWEATELPKIAPELMFRATIAYLMKWLMKWGEFKVNPLTLATISTFDQWRLRKEHDKLRKEFPECASKHPPMCKKACQEEMIAMLDKVKKEGKHINNAFFDYAFTMDDMKKQAWERFPSARTIQRPRQNG